MRKRNDQIEPLDSVLASLCNLMAYEKWGLAAQSLPFPPSICKEFTWNGNEAKHAEEGDYFSLLRSAKLKLSNFSPVLTE